jgi:heptaprenyl diphosphate synthase
MSDGNAAPYAFLYTPAATLMPRVPLHELPLSRTALLDPSETSASPLAEACAHAVRQTGRQMRPRMVLAASKLGFASGEDVLAAMRGVELLHIATLLHDDVIDDGRLRRGEPSVGYRYGALAAQYAGGWMLGAALQLASGLGRRASEMFADVVCELCAGQMLETQHLWDTRRSQTDYERAIAGKTASLFRLAAQLGGVVAGVEDQSLGALGQFGRSFGMAFQLADDLLDLLADPVDVGKERGTDIRRGVYTLPVLYALEADPGLLGASIPSIDELDIHDVVERVRRTDAVGRVVSLCETHLSEATVAARDLGVRDLLELVDEFRHGLDVLT